MLMFQFNSSLPLTTYLNWTITHGDVDYEATTITSLSPTATVGVQRLNVGACNSIIIYSSVSRANYNYAIDINKSDVISKGN